MKVYRREIKIIFLMIQMADKSAYLFYDRARSDDYVEMIICETIPGCLNSRYSRLI